MILEKTDRAAITGSPFPRKERNHMFNIKYCECCGEPFWEDEGSFYCEECSEAISEEKRDNPDFLLDYLKKYCRGKDNAEFSREIEKRFLISGRDIRRIVKSLREQGEPICSDCHHGYYYANNRDEINRTLRGLNEHVNGVSSTIADLRNAELKKTAGAPIIRKIIIVVSPEDDPEDELVMELV